MNNIQFHDFGIKSNLLKKRELKKYLFYVFSTEKKAIERVDIIFCSDNYLLDINQTYLSHDYYTDTVTFTYQAFPVIGEIYISISRIKENSKAFKISYQEELLRIIIHGCLHLCGYDDKSSMLKRIMTKRQEYYLNRYLRFT